MTATNPNEVKAINPPRLGVKPAFPPTPYAGGMTMREYIATAAMQGMLSQDEYEPSIAAAAAVRFADALLAELAK